MSGTGPDLPPATRLGVAIVGAGHMGERHARAWRDAGDAVRVVFDPDLARAAALAAEVGADPVDSAEAAVGLEGVEVVSVCTPTFRHADVTVAALRQGRHVLCEKPIALTLADATRMRRAAQESGRLLRVGFLRRFEAVSLRIRELAPRLGTPLMIQATLSAGVRPKLLMHDARANGGPVIDMCCHLFDQWELLFGESPEAVRAHGATFAADKLELASVPLKAVDSAHITLLYPSGGVGHIAVSWGLPTGVEPLERHSLFGPEGRIEVDWPRRLAFDGAGVSIEEAPVAHDPLPRQIAAFRRELRCGGPAAVADLEDGAAALRLSLAALASIARGGATIRPARLDASPEGV